MQQRAKVDAKSALFAVVAAGNQSVHLDALSAMVTLSVGCASGFDPNPVIHSAVDALLASEVFLGCLHGNVPE